MTDTIDILAAFYSRFPAAENAMDLRDFMMVS